MGKRSSIRLEPVRADRNAAEFSYGVVEYSRGKRTVLGVYADQAAAHSAAQAEVEARAFFASQAE